MKREFWRWQQGGFVLVLAMLAACGPQQQQLENQRFTGDSYFTKATLALSLDQCRDMCLEDGKDCVAWTYTKAREAEPMAECQLFEKLAEAVSDPCCVSGKVFHIHKPDSRAFGKTKRIPEADKPKADE
jgi:hypothetical protein